MDWRAKVELFERIRREYEFGIGTIAGVAKKVGVHRRMVREAIGSALPRPRKKPERPRWKLKAAVEFVDAILECRAMNGFRTRAADVAASLPYTSGTMLSAPREALRNGQLAVAPTSGFHHPGHSTVAGFCTFNGMMVTALALKAEGLAQRVGILDLDQHYGDGTDNIIQTLSIDFVTHFTSGAHYLWGSQAPEFLR